MTKAIAIPAMQPPKCALMSTTAPPDATVGIRAGNSDPDATRRIRAGRFAPA